MKENAIFQFYVKCAGPWLDIVSLARRLSQRVPRLLLLHLVLFTACLAYASPVMYSMGQLEKAVKGVY